MPTNRSLILASLSQPPWLHPSEHRSGDQNDQHKENWKMAPKTYQASELAEREVNLRISLTGNTIKVELPLTDTGRPNEMPFAAVDRQKKEDYLTAATNSISDYNARNNVGGYSIDKITGSGKGGANIQAVSMEFSSTAEANRVFNDPNFLNKLQSDFDINRKREYMNAAAAWTRGIGNEATGGATVPYNGVNVKVSDRTAIGYYAENYNPGKGLGNKEEYESLIRLYDKRHNIDRSRGVSQLDTPASGNDRVASLEDAGNPLNRQYQQALNGTKGDRDAAAVALDTIRNAPGYKENQDISVVQGKNGNFIVSQGQGDAALNLAVPQAKPGDLERVSSQVAQAPQPQPIAQQLDQPERARAPTV
jgi:uncharacterized protein (DUF1330 family)